MSDTNVTDWKSTFPLSGYLKLAMTTNTERTELEHRVHAASGLITEIGELVDSYKRHWFYKTPLNKVNVREEVGDILWYVALAFSLAGLEFHDEIAPLSAVEDDFPIQYVIGKIVRYGVSLSNYTFIYPDDWNIDQVNYDLRNLLQYLTVFAKLNGFTLEEAAYGNIVKLSKRYPDGFSNFNATHRDTVAELSHISST